MEPYESEAVPSSESESESGTLSNISCNSAYCVPIHYRLGNWLTTQLIELNQRGSSDTVSDSRPSNKQKSNPSTSKKYQHMSELDKNMREALRVNKTFVVFFRYKFTDNNTIFREIYFGT